jgi:hypothetical protein
MLVSMKIGGSLISVQTDGQHLRMNYQDIMGAGAIHECREQVAGCPGITGFYIG